MDRAAAALHLAVASRVLVVASRARQAASSAAARSSPRGVTRSTSGRPLRSARTRRNRAPARHSHLARPRAPEPCVRKATRKSAARRPSRPLPPGRRPSLWRPAPAARRRGRSPSRHPSPRRHSSSALEQEPSQLAAHDRHPGVAREPVEHVVTGSSSHTAEQRGPTDPRRHARRGAGLRVTDASPWHHRRSHGRFVPGSDPGLREDRGRIGLPVLVHVSFTSRSGSWPSKNLTGTRRPPSAVLRPLTVGSRSRLRVAPGSIGQVPYQGLHLVNQDEDAESRSLPVAQARPATGQHPSRQTVRSGSQPQPAQFPYQPPGGRP